MNQTNRLLALILALLMICGLCPGAMAGTAESTEAADDPRPEDSLVYATGTFSQNFSPFFNTLVYDQEVVDQVVTRLLANDRGGNIIRHGIEGETVGYNGVDYAYKTMGNVDIVMNDDGTVDYNLTMRDDIVFSDGVPATIDDVIFGVYVVCDPTYDGYSTLSAMPIEGMAAYRSGIQSRGSRIFDDGQGEGYVANSLYTEAQYDAFWDFYNNRAGAAFAREIVDYCIANGYAAPDATVAQAAAEWGFDLAEDATAQDFWNAIAAAYDTVAEAEAAETAGSDLLGLTIAGLGADYKAGVESGASAANIAGIIRTGDYAMTVHMTEYNAKAIYEMNLYVAPMHYYGDAALYDYAHDRFGFPKGDLSMVKARNAAPLGAGPYTFEGYANSAVTLKANPNYYLGEPKIRYIRMQEIPQAADCVPGIIAGSFDVNLPIVSEDTMQAIRDANGNGELTGDVITTVLIDFRGYGFLGINADLVNVGGEPGSHASRALRKGFMTLFAVYRDAAVNAYYGDRASVIQYPISNTSWAAPRPADPGYHDAYSEDVDGNPIYDASMGEAQRYAAARQAAIGYFKAAGLTFDAAAGRFTDVTDTYEIFIPGGGVRNHPAYGVAEAASDTLAGLGITLQVNDVNSAVWNNALDSNTAMMWAGAWQADLDPDMTQAYASANAHGRGGNSNHYQLDDAGLDALIAAGLGSADTQERKRIYRDAMDIVMDWGCELPLYQRKSCVAFSTRRVDTDTIPRDLTPFCNWYANIETLALR